MAERLIKMAEDEAAHRRKMEAEVIAIQGRDQSAYRRSEMFGQIFGLAIGLTAIVGATYMGIHGAQISASIIGTGGVTGLVTAFILGRTMLLKQRQQDYDQQQKMLHQKRNELQTIKED